MSTHDPWDGTLWDITSPDIDQSHGNDYKEIYDLRKGVAIRMNKEHVTLATSSAGGEHKQGSAVAWHLATASIPALQPDATALAATDNGRLWHDITTDIFYVLDDYSDPTVDGGWVAMGNYLGNIAINTNKFTVARATGNTLVAGTFEATGASTLTGAVGCAASITLGAGADLIGSATSDITINTNKFTVAGATGNTVVAGTLGVTGVATVAKGSLLASSDAPTTDAMIANKKYVDDQLAAIATGSRATDDDDSNAMVAAHAYLANQDGFVSTTFTCGAQGSAAYCRVYADSDTNPASGGALIGQWQDQDYHNANTLQGVQALLIKSGEYFEVTSSNITSLVITWTPARATLVKCTDQD